MEAWSKWKSRPVQQLWTEVGEGGIIHVQCFQRLNNIADGVMQNGRVTPRTSSQQSDKGSASPVRTNSLNSISALEQQTTKAPPLAQERQSPQSINAGSHNAKMARMEAPATQGHGGGIPPKIEEGIEPGDTVMDPSTLQRSAT